MIVTPFMEQLFTGPDHGVCPFVVTPHCTHIVEGEWIGVVLTLSRLFTLVVVGENNTLY